MIYHCCQAENTIYSALTPNTTDAAVSLSRKQAARKPIIQDTQ